MSDIKNDNDLGDKSVKVDKKPAKPKPEKVAENGGPQGPEPTRYGDWERKGRCVDF